MDNYQKFVAQIRNNLLLVLLLSNGLIISGWWFGSETIHTNKISLLLVLIGVALILSVLLAKISSAYVGKPMRIVSQALMHIAPDSANIPAPELKNDYIGPELVSNLVSHIYQLANVVSNVESLAGEPKHKLGNDFIANSLPLPLFVLDKNQNVIFANQTAADYIKKDPADIKGQNIYSAIDMSFSSTPTFSTWLADSKANKPVASGSWERVKCALPNEDITRQFDLAAYYNKSNPEGYETILVLFDHSARYAKDDQDLSFIALAVHELRTPVTLMRGYIEAFEEDLEGQLNPELTSYVHKMKASAQKLTAFVNNILDVARIESDQLTLKLHEEKWPDIVATTINDINLRANLHGIQITTEIQDNLPTVGVDRVSIYEVITNLIDNAIKYSGDSKKIIVKSYIGRDGLVETTVQDFGVGIPEGVVPNLFEKFYRSHRSKTKVGGTGLGLYLSKAIVEAHGGHIWVRSREGQGSIFGFSILPYSQLTEEKKSENQDIVRGAHGWIKNHSLYRG